jgi:5-carboxymethyl-2-hydroxymuconate isomerase
MLSMSGPAATTLGPDVPHLTIELSANVAAHHDVDALVTTVHDAALATGVAALDALRTRAAVREHHRIADGDPRFAFVAIHARMAPGRSLEVKQGFLAAVLDAAEAHLVADETPLAIAWSIELTEIDPATRINRNHVRTALEER